MSDKSSNSGSNNSSNEDKKGLNSQAALGKSAELISHGAWHPFDNTFAVARHNSLFIFTEKRS